jgi:hypothetical protein
VKQEPTPVPWEEFDRVVDVGAPPKIDTQSLEVIRNATPTERLAGWLLKGWLALFATLFFFLALHMPAVSPMQVTRVGGLALALSLLLIPLVGRHPSATPLRVGLVGSFGLALCIFLDYPSHYLLTLPAHQDGMGLRFHAQQWQQSLEALAGWASVLPALFVIVAFIFFARWAERRYCWILPTVEWSRIHLGFTILVLVSPVLLILGRVLYLDQSVRDLDWLSAARSHDPYGNALAISPDEVVTLKPKAFKALELKDPEVMRSMLRDLGSEEFNSSLGQVNEQLSGPAFQPTSEDMRALSFIGSRAALKGEPTPESARFALELWKLTNRLKSRQDFWATEQLLGDHTLDFILHADSKELQFWRELIEPLDVFQVTPLDIDASVVDQLAQYGAESEPLRLFGLQVTENSLQEHFAEQWDKAILLDYGQRRTSFEKLSSAQFHDSVMKQEQSYFWLPGTEVNSFYRFLEFRMNPKVLDRSLRLLKTAVALRQSRLETGEYPTELPTFAPLNLEYESQGQTAMLKIERSEDDGGSKEWRLQ